MYVLMNYGKNIFKGGIFMAILERIALGLIIIGALNWGLIGIFDFNLVSFLFGNASVISRIVYIVVFLSGIISLALLFKKDKEEFI